MIFKSRVLNNSVYLIGGEIFSKVIRFFLILYLARIVGVENFGKYGFALAFGGIYILLVDLGINPYLTREIAKSLSSTSHLFSRAILTKFVLFFISIIILAIIIYLMPKDGATKWIVFYITISLMINSLSGTIRAVIHGHQNMADDTKATVLLSVLLAGFGYLVLFKGYGLVNFSIIHLFCSLLEFVFLIGLYFKKYGKVFYNINFKAIPNLIQSSFAFGLQSFFAIAYCLMDTNMLSFMKGDEDVAYYNAAYRFVTIMTFIAIAFGRALYPAISNSFIQAREKVGILLQKGLKVMALTGLVLAIGTSMWAKPVIITAFGPEFTPSIIALQILGWAVAILCLNNLLGPTLRAINKEKFSAKVTMLAFFINISLNLIIIPFYGFVGAAFTTFSTEVFVCVLYFKEIFKVVHLKGNLFSIIVKAIISASFMLLPMILFHKLIWYLQIPVSLLSVLVVTLLIKVFTNEEIEGILGDGKMKLILQKLHFIH